MTRLNSFVSAALVIGIIAMATQPTCAQANPPAQGATQQSIPPDQLDQLLAPIALYPDALIVQILDCSSSPYQITQVSDWLSKNPDLHGTAVQDAASEQGFDASFIALVLFPQVVHMMAEKIDWTKQLGQAFAADHDGVFAAIQRLRKEAESMGNLASTPQQTVQNVTTDNGQQVIVIQPANPQVVYVPQYNPTVVYTQPAPATVTVQSDPGHAVAAGLIGFAAGVIVGAAADNDHDHYYYACGGWGYRGPVLYPGGYNNYYRHRENMANDYYDYRENMARQRGDNMSNRQDFRLENQSDRRDTMSQNQSSRQSNRTENQAGRQDARGQNQAARQSTVSQNRAGRQEAAGRVQGPTIDRGATTSRGAYSNRFEQTRPSTTGTQSGAFSGYQRGSTERASSARGRSSIGNRSSAGGAARGTTRGRRR